MRREGTRNSRARREGNSLQAPPHCSDQWREGNSRIHNCALKSRRISAEGGFVNAWRLWSSVQENNFFPERLCNMSSFSPGGNQNGNSWKCSRLIGCCVPPPPHRHSWRQNRGCLGGGSRVGWGGATVVAICGGWACRAWASAPRRRSGSSPTRTPAKQRRNTLHSSAVSFGVLTHTRRSSAGRPVSRR